MTRANKTVSSSLNWSLFLAPMIVAFQWSVHVYWLSTRSESLYSRPHEPCLQTVATSDCVSFRQYSRPNIDFCTQIAECVYASHFACDEPFFAIFFIYFGSKDWTKSIKTIWMRSIEPWNYQISILMKVTCNDTASSKWLQNYTASRMNPSFTKRTILMHVCSCCAFSSRIFSDPISP